jgi:hypothetical protein
MKRMMLTNIIVLCMLLAGPRLAHAYALCDITGNWAIEVNSVGLAFIRAGTFGGNANAYWVGLGSTLDANKSKLSLALAAFLSGKRMAAYFGSLNNCAGITNWVHMDNLIILPN